MARIEELMERYEEAVLACDFETAHDLEIEINNVIENEL